MLCISSSLLVNSTGCPVRTRSMAGTNIRPLWSMIAGSGGGGKSRDIFGSSVTTAYDPGDDGFVFPVTLPAVCGTLAEVVTASEGGVGGGDDLDHPDAQAREITTLHPRALNRHKRPIQRI